ncbi:MAG: FtsX-like permease family protein, partial [Saprospiraceae bacterium]|nr:FtsX-like permease family protein [Saprospiraceae bacterium]
MAWGLIHVINRRAFGWSLSMDVSLITLLGGVLLALVAAIAAGWYPAKRMARTPPAVDLRYE